MINNSMTISANTINSRVARKKSKRVGRGNSSQKGTTAARGMNGQKSRSGGKSGTARLGMKQSLLKIPKNRGFTSIKPKKKTVTLSTLIRIAGDETITPHFLEKKGVISQASFGVKIVGAGAIDKKINIKDCSVSKGATEAIKSAGGSVV